MNRPNADVEWVDFENYQRILTDGDIWATMQATAHFLIWTLIFQVLIGFALAWLINKKFRGNDLWTTIIVLPMMLSPAVCGELLDLPLPAADRRVQLCGVLVSCAFPDWMVACVDPASFDMIGMTDGVSYAPRAIVIVDTCMWTPFVMLICLAWPEVHP